MILRQAVIGDIEAISHIESLCFPKAEAATYEQFKQGQKVKIVGTVSINDFTSLMTINAVQVDILD